MDNQQQRIVFGLECVAGATTQTITTIIATEEEASGFVLAGNLSRCFLKTWENVLPGWKLKESKMMETTNLIIAGGLHERNKLEIREGIGF